ncbi:SIR2 family protein [Pseudarthrobacter quantipunctorum]|uniref:SIR2 family protein n=1 Tax=Pseudarthrobacter quantipunctorum TaxID=3128980 RepID=A0ABZ2R9A8_9MICC
MDLPEAVLDAQVEERLVLFVGAGASVDAPSGLPLFDKLARQLAAMARVPFEDKVALDFFLGSMPKSFDTHRHTRNIIASEGSAPNSTHTALVRVASSVGRLRIVTTNFDNHLSSAAVAGGIHVPDMWIGPALPLGEDFTGIVHLHGSVLREPQDLVLTDGDFGRAYLTNAWATRFLLPMFQTFTVLFIGYSHDDPIMRYLALGLPSGTPRFAFTSDDDVDDPKWSRLGVQTIGYAVDGHNHSALVAALEAWDLRARMGQTEHRAQIIEVVNGGATLTPVDYDYLVGQLKTVYGASEFVQAVSSVNQALQVEWLHWAEGMESFKSIFAGGKGDSAAAILGSWFCDSFIGLPELHGAALQTVQRLGQAFSDGLFRRAGWAASKLSTADPNLGRRWKAFLATSVQGHSAPVATETLLPYLTGNHPEDVTVLRAALRPFLVLKRRWLFNDADDLTAVPDAEVQWNTNADTLTGHVMKAVELATPGDLKLGSVLEDSLDAAYDLLDAYHGERTWDPLSFSRAAIEPHEQDQFREPVDALIDGLRAYGEKSLTSLPDLPERWWSLDRILFRRLALHLLSLEGSRTGDEKILWLLERHVLYETDLKHETYRVLKTATINASAETRQLLLTAAQDGPNLPEDIPNIERHTAYATYNLLVWLSDVAPDWSEAGAALAATQAANPDFAPREHPDFDNWMTSGTWGGQLPMEPDNFIATFEQDPATAISDIVSRDYSKRNFNEPDWHDALSLLTRMAESRPDLGEKLWSLVNEWKESDTRSSDVRGAIIEGWAKANISGIADAVVAQVATQIAKFDSAHIISRFLLEQVRRQIESDETPALATMRSMAVELWREHNHSFVHSEGVDLNGGAPLYLNSWPGDLALYWLEEIDRRWRKHREDWSGLSEEERTSLTQLLSGPRHALDATQPAVASHLFFLFVADAEFSSQHVLPLFRDPTSVGLVWNAYLHHPRYNDKLLAAGLLEGMITAWAQLDALKGPSFLRQQFFALVIAVISFAGISPSSRQALLDKSVLADDGKYAAEFAHAVVRFLSHDGVDGTEVWKRWLRDHLTARLNGVPRTSEMEELTCWADTVPYLEDSIPDAAKLLSSRGIGLGDNFLPPDIPEGALSAHGLKLMTYFSERIRNSSTSNYFTAHRVKELINRLRSALGDEGVQPLVEEATNRGFLSDDNMIE